MANINNMSISISTMSSIMKAYLMAIIINNVIYNNNEIINQYNVKCNVSNGMK
jgi:hypothetical protein